MKNSIGMAMERGLGRIGRRDVGCPKVGNAMGEWECFSPRLSIVARQISDINVLPLTKPTPQSSGCFSLHVQGEPRSLCLACGGGCSRGPVCENNRRDRWTKRLESWRPDNCQLQLGNAMILSRGGVRRPSMRPQDSHLGAHPVGYPTTSRRCTQMGVVVHGRRRCRTT